MSEKIEKIPFTVLKSEKKTDNESDNGTVEDTEDYDTCEGCHWCNPEAHPEKPPVIPLPEGHAISIHCLTKKCDEGIITDWDNWFKMFSSYESASKAILKFYKEADYDRYDDSTNEKPPIGWACKEYNPTALSKFYCEHDINLYGEYGDIYEVCRSYPVLFIKIGKLE